jgi:hypothetical protein
VFLPERTGRQPVLGLPLAMLPERLDRRLGEREGLLDLAVLVSPPWRTECHTATDGGTGRAAPGPPSRST